MGIAIYMLCALTSVACALLLFRQYRRRGGGLLLWSTVCFLCFALGNILLFVDLVILPGVDLSLWRTAITLTGMVTLLYGLIDETT